MEEGDGRFCGDCDGRIVAYTGAWGVALPPCTSAISCEGPERAIKHVTQRQVNKT